MQMQNSMQRRDKVESTDNWPRMDDQILESDHEDEQEYRRLKDCKSI